MKATPAVRIASQRKSAKNATPNGANGKERNGKAAAPAIEPIADRLAASLPTGATVPMPAEMIDARELLAALIALRRGDFSVRLGETREGIGSRVAEVFNDVVELNQ